MSRTLFIGDSHTVGYQTVAGKTGPGSYSFWNSNNYCEIYQTLTNKPVVIYAQPGSTNTLYTTWLKNMFEKFDDITEVYICLAPLNRMVISFDPKLENEAVPVNHFTIEHQERTESVRKFSDQAIAGETVQILTKPTGNDYQNSLGLEFNPDKGLIKPDLRKDPWMNVKLYNECNTMIEKKEFLLNLYAWDNICADNNAKLYVFNFRSRGVWPSKTDYFGKMKVTKRAEKSVEDYLQSLNIQAKDYFLEDEEHFNIDYHTAVAEKYIPWLKSL